ncbi:hypothetical protein BMF94_6718, partial [Rhodotorula taiwanensis]
MTVSDQIVLITSDECKLLAHAKNELSEPSTIFSMSLASPLSTPLAPSLTFTSSKARLVVALLPPVDHTTSDTPETTDANSQVSNKREEEAAAESELDVPMEDSLPSSALVLPAQPATDFLSGDPIRSRLGRHLDILRALVDDAGDRARARGQLRASSSSDARGLLETLDRRLRLSAFHPETLSGNQSILERFTGTPETVSFLTAVTRDPFVLPISGGTALTPIAYDLFSTHLPIDEHFPKRSQSMSRYLRLVIMPDEPTTTAYLMLHGQLFPADSPKLRAIRSALDARTAHKSEPVALKYFGQTERTTPLGRAQDDQNASQSFVKNVIAVLKALILSEPIDATMGFDWGKVQFVLHEFADLEQTSDGPIDISDFAVGGVEIALITSASAGLNSAIGGFRPTLDRSSFGDICSLMQKHDADLSRVRQLLPVAGASPTRAEKIAAAAVDSLQFWQTRPEESGYTLDDSTESGTRVFQTVLEAMQAVKCLASDPGGPTLELLVMKDVPKADLLDLQTSHGPRAGRGPHLGFLVDSSVLGASIGTWTAIAPMTNLWQWQLRHLKVGWAICFLIRYICCVDPLLLRVFSGKMSHLFRSSLICGALDTSAPGLDDFLACASSTTEASLEAILSKSCVLVWRELAPSNHMRDAGKTSVVQWGPHASNLSIIFAELDPGFHKYDPSVSDLVVDLVQLTAAKAAFAREALGRLLAFEYGATGAPAAAAPRREFLREARRRCEARSVAMGLEARLLRARDELATAFGALNAARQLSAGDRRLADDEDRKRERRSESAHLGVANRAAQLEFLGPPLPAPVMSVLELHYSAPDDGFLSPKLLSLTSYPVLGDPLDPATLWPRLVQLVDLLAEHTEATLDGLESPVSALPTTGAPVASREWVGWFCRAPEGVEVARSASKAGWAGERDWDAEARALQSEQQRAREEQKRASRG